MVSTAAVKRALSALASRTDTATRPSVAVIDEADAARLWEVSEALTGVEYDFEASSQAA